MKTYTIDNFLSPKLPFKSWSLGSEKSWLHNQKLQEIFKIEMKKLKWKEFSWQWNLNSIPKQQNKYISTALENSYINLHTPHKFKWYFHTGLLFYFKIENKPTVLQTWVNICDNILLIWTRSAIQKNFPLHKMKPFLEYLRLIYKLCMLGMGYLLVSVINHSSAILWLYLKMQTGVFYQLCMLGMGYLLVFVINHSSAIVRLYLKVQTGVFYQLCMLGMGYLLVSVINHSSAIVWLYLKVQTSTRELIIRWTLSYFVV